MVFHSSVANSGKIGKYNLFTKITCQGGVACTREGEIWFYRYLVLEFADPGQPENLRQYG